jgi:AcrR family transcriptional regulator
MGRKAKLTEAQWEEIKRRVVADESMTSLAREFGISKALVSKHCSKKAERIRVVANKLVDASKALNNLPEGERPLAVRLADDLKSISQNVARAAKAGSATGAALAELATERAKSVMLAEPKDGHLVDRGVMDDVADLSIASNRALAPAMRLLIAGQGKDDPDEEKPQSLEELYERLLG